MTLRSDEQFVASDDAWICAQAFGQPRDRAVLLIGGAASTMDFWEDEFCSLLAGADRFVIRYDLRDTGKSTGYPAGAPGYTGQDLIIDALAVLDAFDVEQADLVGISMGGALAQRLALDHPERVSGLVLQSTSLAVDRAIDGPELPPMEPRLAEVFASDAPAPDWSDREAAIDAMVAAERLFAGSLPFDSERVRRIATRAYDRTANVAAMQTNHWILGDGQSTTKRLSDITAPSVVLHGTEDPLFPLAHGEALAREITGARLVPLPGMGHQYPPEPLWDPVIREIVGLEEH